MPNQSANENRPSPLVLKSSPSTRTTGDENRDTGIGIVLLAAGASVRMGTPKQLLKVEGVSLIRRAAEHALDSGCWPVVVVLGASAELIAPELDGLSVKVVLSRDWKSGLSASIRTGVQNLLVLDSQVHGVILFLGDQPNVTGASLRRLAMNHVQSGAKLVAASYSNHIGTPALFSRSYFGELLSLVGGGGAKEILNRYASDVSPVHLPEAAFDLDTPRDLAALKNLSHQDRTPEAT